MRPGRRPLAALDLADAFIRDSGAGDGPQRDTIRAIVLAAGELLAARGRPGLWITLEPADLLAAFRSASAAEHTELCFHLLAFVTWLAANLHIDPDRPLSMADAILASGATDPRLVALCRFVLSDPRSIPLDD